MPVWCPDCHAMLPEGLAECPRCGTPLGDVGQPAVGGREMFWYSVITIGFVLVALLVPVAIGLLCVYAAR